MMRRSGASPVVNRSKLSCEMLRRAASGHIEATQLSKLAAASRIALAVIRGWPEAPSSPLQGGAPPPPGGVCPCAALSGRAAVWPPFEKRLSRKFSGPPPDDCAWAPTGSSKAAASAAVRQFAIRTVRSAIFRRTAPKVRLSGSRALVANELTFEINKGASSRDCCSPWQGTNKHHLPLLPAANRLPI